MSVAFTKEEDSESTAANLPDRPVSPHPNLVTPEGLAQLDAALAQAVIDEPYPMDELEPAPVTPIRRSSEPDRLNPKYQFETFVIGSSNRFAHAAAVAVAEAPEDRALADARGRRHRVHRQTLGAVLGEQPPCRAQDPLAVGGCV